jgi:CBS domain-containing protein
MVLARWKMPVSLSRSNAMTQVSEVMTRGVHTLPPTESILKAAQAMKEMDVGAIPVCDGQQLLGMVTDRDIVLRAVAEDRVAHDTPLSQVMTQDACWCFEDQSVDEAAEAMREAQVRRMPVVDREKHLVGMLSLGDVATKAGEEQAGQALEGISEPSRPAR